MYSCTHSLTSALYGVDGQRHVQAELPLGKTRYLLHSRPVGPQDHSVRVRKISSLLGFDPETVQPVASTYTDWAISAYMGRGYRCKPRLAKGH
jgi:hypothetical protein